MRSIWSGGKHAESRDFAQSSPRPCPCFQPSCSPVIRASQAPGKLQVLIPGLVPRINNEGTSHRQGSPETTTHHKGQEEAEVLARAEGGLGHVGQAGGVRTRAHGQVPSRAAQCEERKGSQPPEPSALTTVVIGARAALFPSGASLGIPKSEPRTLDKGHREPALAQAKPCRGGSRYGLPTRAGARREKAERHGQTGNSQAQRQGGLASRLEGCAWKPSITPMGFSSKAPGTRAHILVLSQP